MKALCVLGTGGHTIQMSELASRLGFGVEYVIAREDKFSEKRIKKRGKVRKIYSEHVSAQISLKSLLALAACVVDSFFLALSIDADAVITVGPGFAVPLCYWMKLFGKKVVFIESWSRIHHKSASGKLVYPIADLFFVQWPEMKKLYPKAVYVGRLA
ncbi:PssD/Cps14F family polysaccharide biosynthesis glycosyltransferase [archaeon]